MRAINLTLTERKHKMEKRYPKYIAAAVQAAPVYMNREKTLEKACSMMDEAASNGADLVAFPESFISGYPWWNFVGTGRPFVDMHQKMLENAVEVPDETVRVLGECCRKNKIYACIPVNEKDGSSVYLTQLWFDPEGNMIGKHRKMNLVSAERMAFGTGDGSTVSVIKTELGNIGGLFDFEHMHPMNIPVMASMGEQVHVASWNAFRCKEDDLFSVEAAMSASRYYAQSSGTFVLMTSAPYTEEMSAMILREDWHKDPVPFGGAKTCIINPHGVILAEVDSDIDDGICYGEIDLEDIVTCKFLVDITGHYSTPGICHINFDRTVQSPVRTAGDSRDYRISYDDMQAE